MDENQFREIASQLARPSGEGGSLMGEKMNDVNAFITERSIERLASVAGERVVEIGPGNGILSLPIIRSIGRNGHYVGLELSEDMARQAEENLGRQASSSVEIQTGDCMKAAIEENTIDGLMAVNVLYFIDDISTFLTRVASWLKPGGRAIFGIRSSESMKKMPFASYGFRIRTLNEIVDQLNANGFGGVDSVFYDEGTSKLGELDIPMDCLIIRALAT